MFTLADVTAFLGVPMPGLTQPMVDAAAVSVRRYCRWHIAPPVTETVRANADGCTVRYAVASRHRCRYGHGRGCRFGRVWLALVG